MRGGWGCDAAWADDFHHALRVLLTGDREGYYAEFGAPRRPGEGVPPPARPRRPVLDVPPPPLRRQADDVPPERFVVFSANHDQVGNRAFGDRLPVELRPLAAFCTLLSPFTPMLFQGEEYGEDAPFQFFTDHIDEEIADGHARGPPARVRRVRRVPRARGARPAGPGHVRALQAHARRASRRASASCTRRCCACAASCRRATPTRSSSTSTPGGCACSAARTRWWRTSPATTVHVPVDGTVEPVVATAHMHARARLRGPRRPVGGTGAAGGRRERPLAGEAVPAGRRRGTANGTNFSLFSENAERVELCLFDDEDNETRVELTERTAFNWHVLPPGRRSRPALRLPRPRPVRPACRPPLQPGQAADRPVREVDRGPIALEPRQRAALRARRRRRRRRRPRARRRGRRAAAIPKCVVIDARFDWEGDRPPNTPLERDGDLRDARQGLHDAPPGRARGPARHVRRAGRRTRRSSTSRSSASPRSSCCRSTTSPTSRSSSSAG